VITDSPTRRNAPRYRMLKRRARLRHRTCERAAGNDDRPGYGSFRAHMMSLLADDFLVEYRDCDPFEEFLESGLAERIRPLAPFHQSLYVFNKTRLPNYILVGERLDMAHSVEVRLPYLDHHLFECASRMPLQLYRRNGQEKYVLRQLLGRMMSTGHMGAKRPFLAPPRMKQGGGHSYRYFLDQIVASRTMTDQPFFSQRKLRSALRNMKSWLPQDSESAEAIWQMLSRGEPFAPKGATDPLAA